MGAPESSNVNQSSRRFMSYLSQNFRLFRLSNLSVLRFCLSCSCKRSQSYRKWHRHSAGTPSTVDYDLPRSPPLLLGGSLHCTSPSAGRSTLLAKFFPWRRGLLPDAKQFLRTARKTPPLGKLSEWKAAAANLSAQSSQVMEKRDRRVGTVQYFPFIHFLSISPSG